MTHFQTLSLLTRAAAWCLLAGAAHAQAPSAPAAPDADHAAQVQHRAAVRAETRQAIEAQRNALKARQAAAEQACWKKFAVEGCLRDVRHQARQEDNILRDRELHINNEERRDKADGRLRAIEQKRQEGHAPAPVQATSRPPLRGDAGAPPASPPVSMPASAPKSAPTPAPAVPAAEQPAAPAKPQADPARSQSVRDAEAHVRAAQQAQRAQAKQAAAAQRELSEAQRRATAQQATLDKQAEAASRAERKAEAPVERTGKPLPIPQGLPPAP